MPCELSANVICGFPCESMVRFAICVERFEAALFGKLFSDATPAITGASAAGICGSLALAQCDSPFTTYLWMDVCKPAATCAAVPENSITVRPLETMMD